jgi:SCY1-like protein 1
MNFLRSFITSETANWFYELGAENTAYIDNPYFKLFAAKKLNQSNNLYENFSCFYFDKLKYPDKLAIAKNFLSKLKQLRPHGAVLKYIDSIETTNFIQIITEECQLFNYQQNEINSEVQSSDLLVSLGFHQISSAIAWLNNKCQLIHGSLSINSIYVVKSGEFKLGGFYHTYKYQEPVNDYSSLFERNNTLPIHYRSPEQQKASSNQSFSQYESENCFPVWYLDSWGLGCIIFDIFNQGFKSQNQLTNISVINKSLQSEYKKLLSVNCTTRLNPEKLIESAYFNNDLIASIKFLDEFTIKNTEEKENFFTQFNSNKVVDKFPENILKYKLLPLLTQTLNYGNSINPNIFAIILTSALQISKLLSTAEFNDTILPIITKLFASTDRAIRAHLLQNFHEFAGCLSADLINNSIFTHVAGGFIDQVPKVRELTVKTLPHIVGKLNSTHMESVIKACIKLQNDPEPAIRTNTTYSIAKMAPSLNAETREKLLLPAFGRAMRDNFPPARVAGLVSCTVTLEYHNGLNCARKLLPSVSPLCVDDSIEVREAAIKCTQAVLNKLIQFHEQIKDSGVKPEESLKSSAGNNSSSGSAASSWGLENAGGLVSNFGSYLSSKIIAGAVGETVTSPNLNKSPSVNSPGPIVNSSSSNSLGGLHRPSNSVSSASSSTNPATHNKSSSLSASAAAAPKKSDDYDSAWNNDDFTADMNEDSEEEPAAILTLSTKKDKAAGARKPISSKSPASSYSAKPKSVDKDDPFNLSFAPTTASTTTKASSKANASSLDDWDSFAGSISAASTSNINNTSSFDPLAKSPASTGSNKSSTSNNSASIAAKKPGAKSTVSNPASTANKSSKPAGSDDWSSFLND